MTFRLYTADVLAVWDAVPTGVLRPRDIAAQLGVPVAAVSGHLWHLRRTGKIERVGRGVYRRTAFGDVAREAA